MANLPWLDRLRCELQKRNVPAGYRDRLIDELADHLTDLQQENPSMDAQLLVDKRLGTPESVAMAAQNVNASRAFAERHPFLTFAVAPIPIVIGIWYLTIIVTLLIAMAAGMTGEFRQSAMAPPTTLQWSIVHALVYVDQFLPFALTAWLFASWARRAQRPRWGMAACTIVACFAFVFWISIIPDGRSAGIVQFGPAYVIPARQWLQAAVPLAVGLWAWRRSLNPSNGASLPVKTNPISASFEAPGHAIT